MDCMKPTPQFTDALFKASARPLKSGAAHHKNMKFLTAVKHKKSVYKCFMIVVFNLLQDISVGKKIVLAFQTLGVVFGDVGTSPLYTFSVMFKKAPINENEDILGALSLVLYTLILIPLVKYILVVLWANDNGEGILS